MTAASITVLAAVCSQVEAATAVGAGSRDGSGM